MPEASEHRTTEALDATDGADSTRYLLSFFHPGGVETAELRKGQSLVVGRAEPADVRLRVQSLSRVHCRVGWEAGGVFLEDLGSRNGTFVGGTALGRAELAPGGAAQLGGVTLVLQRLPPSEPNRPSSTDAPNGSSPPFAVLCSARMKALYGAIERMAATDLPVLVTGETGVGKELVASALHQLGPRARGPLRAINCGAIADSLLSSVLFGHERGAFTGAVQASKGIFEQADGGTVFLDEVGELSASMQVALLRVLETGCVTRLGTERERKLDVRVVAATHRDLEAMVQQGTFRADLLFRLDTLSLHVPALRERPEDIGPLAEHFVRLAAQRQRVAARNVGPEVLAKLAAYGWPGNVRELRNVIERAVVMAQGAGLTLDDLPERIVGGSSADPASVEGGAEPDAEAQLTAHEGYRDRVRDYEVQLITETLRQTGGSRARAAELLQLPLRTLAHKIKQYGI